MNFELSKSDKESLKEFARIILLSTLPTLIVYLESPDMGFKTFLVSASIATLKALDKRIHEQGKEEGNESKIRGLTRF